MKENVHYLVQVLSEQEGQRGTYKVDYYKALPLTNNTKFKRCTWPNDMPVKSYQIEKILEAPDNFKENMVEHREGQLSGLPLKM